MKRVVPKTHSIEIEFLNGVTITDIIVGACCFLVLLLVIFSPMPFKFQIASALLCLSVALFFKVDEERLYQALFYIFKYVSAPKIFIERKENVDVKAEPLNSQGDKKVDGKEKKGKKKKEKKEKKTAYIDEFFPIKSIADDFLTFTDGFSAFVIEIKPIFFEYLTKNEKSHYIDKVYAKVLRLLNSEQKAQLIKLNMKKHFDAYVDEESLKARQLDSEFRENYLNESEYVIRQYVIDERVKNLKKYNKTEPIYEKKFFLVVYGKNRQILEDNKKQMYQIFNENKLVAKILNKYETAIFLKANYYTGFDEKQAYNCKSEEDLLKWVKPKEIKIGMRNIIIDKHYMYCYKVADLPNVVDDAWASEICDIPNVKLVFNIKPIETSKAIRALDNSIDEIQERQTHNSKASKTIDLQNELEALVSALSRLRASSENFFEMNMFVMIEDLERTKYEMMPKERQAAYKLTSTLRKDFSLKMREKGFKLEDGYLKQKYLFKSLFASYFDYFKKKCKGLYGELIGASFPFVSQVVSDVGGYNIGWIDKQPAIFDFFKRDNVHVNSNMIIIGKSGSGKSYYTKLLLSNLGADNSKIFILDPENEYKGITKNYNGKSINLANSRDGLINPFQVTQVLSEEDDNDNTFEGVSEVQQAIGSHLQFLEGFFELLLEGISNDAFEILNNLIKKLYDKPIFRNCDSLDKLRPEDFPIFDDLYNLINEEKENSNVEYYKNNLEILSNYISKFANGGRNSYLWNGYSRLETTENMIQFNYQQLLANDNTVISNAQMLLVIHWLNNEIINNRNHNLKNNTNRKIIVVVDEAHVFINEKHPVALDFMFNLAKRIRKYGGMQVVITQNIKDFVGTKELSRKSTAIINASQYSFIFSLAPDDINDLVELYSKSGGISADEQAQILNNERGQAYFMMSPIERGTVKIELTKSIAEVFNE